MLKDICLLYAIGRCLLRLPISIRHSWGISELYWTGLRCLLQNSLFVRNTYHFAALGKLCPPSTNPFDCWGFSEIKHLQPGIFALPMRFFYLMFLLLVMQGMGCFSLNSFSPPLCNVYQITVLDYNS